VELSEQLAVIGRIAIFDLARTEDFATRDPRWVLGTEFGSDFGQSTVKLPMKLRKVSIENGICDAECHNTLEGTKDIRENLAGKHLSHALLE
jgi:hypothetical protein